MLSSVQTLGLALLGSVGKVLAGRSGGGSCGNLVLGSARQELFEVETTGTGRMTKLIGGVLGLTVTGLGAAI